MKLWQCQIESDKDAGEADETKEEVDEGGTDEEGGGEDESEEDGEPGEKETEENSDEEEEEDAETFGYEKIEKSEVEQLDCSSMGNRLESTTSINLNHI